MDQYYLRFLFRLVRKSKQPGLTKPEKSLAFRSFCHDSLRSKRLEEVGTRKNGRARRRPACARSLFTHYFQAPATQAIATTALETYIWVPRTVFLELTIVFPFCCCFFPGPLVCEKDNRWYLVGATSWGWGCAGQYYGVYTNIAKLYNWIKANTL